MPYRTVITISILCIKCPYLPSIDIHLVYHYHMCKYGNCVRQTLAFIIHSASHPSQEKHHPAPIYLYTMNGSVLNMTNDITDTYLGLPGCGAKQQTAMGQPSKQDTQGLLGFLHRNMYGCPAAVKEWTYMTLVCLLVEYCSPVWSPHQRVAARFVTRRPYRHSAPDSVTALIMCLIGANNNLSHKASLTSLYKMVDGHVAIPDTYHPASKPH